MFRTSKPLVIPLTVLMTTVYGMGVVFVFDQNQSLLDTLSWSFIMLLPYSVGALGNLFLLQHRKMSLAGAILWPWLFIIALFIAATIASFGLLFCIIIGLPLLLPAASLGGVTPWLLKNFPRAATVLVLFLLLSPFAASPVEAQFEKPVSLTSTHTFTDIDAPVETVWSHIKSVEAITAAEQHSNWLHWVGLPRPIAATLSHDGVGGVRNATFENGLRFDETIIEWRHHQTISFTIVETSEALLPPPLNLIDGENFAVLQGTYTIEPLPDGIVRLHLSSEHMLGTRFNQYGAWWTDLVMRNLQNYILTIVKARAENS